MSMRDKVAGDGKSRRLTAKPAGAGSVSADGGRLGAALHAHCLRGGFISLRNVSD
jgi:hypothetical protein